MKKKQITNFPLGCGPRAACGKFMLRLAPYKKAKKERRKKNTKNSEARRKRDRKSQKKEES